MTRILNVLAPVAVLIASSIPAQSGIVCNGSYQRVGGDERGRGPFERADEDREPALPLQPVAPMNKVLPFITLVCFTGAGPSAAATGAKTAAAGAAAESSLAATSTDAMVFLGGVGRSCWRSAAKAPAL